MRRVFAVRVHEKRDLLKRYEGNSERENDVCEKKVAAENVVGDVDKEVRVFEIG